MLVLQDITGTFYMDNVFLVLPLVILVICGMEEIVYQQCIVQIQHILMEPAVSTELMDVQAILLDGEHFVLTVQSGLILIQMINPVS
jgi:hypothetical protein